MYSLIALGVCGFLIAWVTTPWVSALGLKLGAIDKPDGGRRLHRYPVPKLGGVAVFVAYLGSFGFVWLFSPFVQSLIREYLRFEAGLAAAILIVFLVSIIDDFRELKPWQKLSGQSAGALVAFAAGVRIEAIQGIPLPFWLGLPITLLWLVACANAFNLIDGLDGLVAGVGLFACGSIFVAGLTSSSIPLAVAMVPLAGALLAFLRYNFNPASVFLGECGSVTMGFFLACCAVIWGQKSAALLGMTAPVMALAIPLFDTAIVVIRRFLRRQPILVGDRQHIHHRLLELGLSPGKAVLLLYAACGLAAALSLAANALAGRFSGAVVLVFCAAAWFGIRRLGYAEFGAARALLFDGRFRRMIDWEVKLSALEKRLAQAGTLQRSWELVRAASGDFGCCGLRLAAGSGVLTSAAALPEPCYELKIPLRKAGEHITLYREIQEGEDAIPFFGFGSVLRAHFSGFAAAGYPSQLVCLKAPAERATRVLQVGKFYPPHYGGIETHLHSLSLQLRRKGVDVRVLAANDSRETIAERVDGVPLCRCAMKLFVASTPWCPELRRRIQTSNADLVHLHLPNPYATWAYATSGHMSPLVVTYHSDVVRQRVLNSLYQPLLERILYRADAIIVTSPQYIASSPVLTRFRDRCHVIPLGIPLQEYERCDEAALRRIREIYGREKLILAVGRLVYYKGFEYLIRAMSSVDATLLIVGVGPLHAQLTALAREVGVSRRVRFLGRVASDELIACYHAADLFVLPSIARSEAFGQVQVEAMAAGKPVINTDLDTGVPYVSLNGVTGLTVRHADAAALSVAMNLLLGNDDLRANYGHAARQRARDTFSVEAMAAKTFDLYRKVRRKTGGDHVGTEDKSGIVCRASDS